MKENKTDITANNGNSDTTLIDNQEFKNLLDQFLNYKNGKGSKVLTVSNPFTDLFNSGKTSDGTEHTD